MVSILTMLAAIAAGGFFTAWATDALDRRRSYSPVRKATSETAAVIAVMATTLTVVFGAMWGAWYALAVH